MVRVQRLTHKKAMWLDFAVLFIGAVVLEGIAATSDMPKIMSILTKMEEKGGGHVTQQRYLKPISNILEEVRGHSSVGGRGRGDNISNSIGKTLCFMFYYCKLC